MKSFEFISSDVGLTKTIIKIIKMPKKIKTNRNKGIVYIILCVNCEVHFLSFSAV